MVAESEGKWLGLLTWGSAAYRLKPRDAVIAWTPTQRAQRQKLVVQNRRFLLLGERGEQPNLASRVLGAAVRDLPRLWFAHFGYEPLLAETFTDIEAYAGSCYKAAAGLRAAPGRLLCTQRTLPCAWPSPPPPSPCLPGPPARVPGFFSPLRVHHHAS